MADNKPNNNANAPKPAAAPEPKKSSGVKKFFMFVLVAALAGTGGSIWWHGKKLGEAKAKAEGKSVAEAENIMFWKWTSEDWRGWYSSVEDTAGKAGDAVSAKAAALKAKVEAWRAAKTSATTTGTTPTGTTPVATPTTPPTGTTPPTDTVAVTAPAAAPPAGFADAAKLVDDGNDAWDKHDYPTAKTKLTEAVKQLKGMPAHPSVTKALELANGLLEDIEMNSPH